MMTWIAIDRPVAVLQLDVMTDATTAPIIAQSVTTKDLSCAPITGGYRCLLSRLNQATVTGRIIDVAGNVTGVSNVVGGDLAGLAVPVVIVRISQPRNVTALPKLR